MKNLQNHRKTSVSESLFDNVAGLKTLHHKCFSLILGKLLAKHYDQTPYKKMVQLTYSGQNNNIKSDTVIQELYEHYMRTD